MTGNEDFFDEKLEKGLLNNYRSDIRLKSDFVLKRKPIRPLSTVEHNALRKYISESLRKGYIVPTVAEYTSGIVIVPKKGGEHRVCIDFRELNSLTEMDSYPIPLIDDLLNQIKNKNVYSKIDLRDAYHQVALSEESKKYTAFRCSLGTFRYEVLPFGPTNAPSQFQRMLDALFFEFN
jgi:Reverse transcriptase (RNA-dependent DNA polymerase)